MAITPHKTAKGGREDGAIILTFSLMLLFLIGFAAMAIDLGRLFVVRTELQTAADSCALAAAQELDGQATAINRAVSAGLTAGNLNRVNMQSDDWAGQAKLVAEDITFRDATYMVTAAAASARYVQCRHTQNGVEAFLLRAMSAFSGTDYPATFSIAASAVATRANAQTSCPIPVALRPNGNREDKDGYGLEIGDWITVLTKDAVDSTLPPGQIGWVNLDNSQSGQTTNQQMGEKGTCDVAIGSTLGGTQGAKTQVDKPWNQRFGIYRGSDGASESHPDFTGFAYKVRPAGGAYPDYVNKRNSYTPYDKSSGMPNGFQRVATSDQHRQFGYNRRLVVVPVIDSTKVVDFVCMLMVAPLNGPNDEGKLEYLGFANSDISPCTSSGLAGGSAGPLVPVLVR